MNRKTYTIIGACIGLTLFSAVALLPSILYGGYAGHLLAGGIVGAEMNGIIARSLVVFGMALGVVGVGSLFTVLGAMVGAAVSALTGVTLTALPARK